MHAIPSLLPSGVCVVQFLDFCQVGCAHDMQFIDFCQVVCVHTIPSLLPGGVCGALS